MKVRVLFAKILTRGRQKGKVCPAPTPLSANRIEVKELAQRRRPRPKGPKRHQDLRYPRDPRNFRN